MTDVVIASGRPAGLMLAGELLRGSESGQALRALVGDAH